MHNTKEKAWLPIQFCLTPSGFALGVVMVLVLGCRNPSWAQYEFNAWRFGYRAGLNFPVIPAASPPVPATANDLFFSLEASATAADSAGNLLCYTNGEQVWNRQDRPMLNGKLSGGCNSAAQGALLLPRPGYRQQYFLLTVDCFENQLAQGPRYSIVDMAQDGGLGAVQLPNSSQVFVPGFNYRLTEALTAVRHADGFNYWVVMHEWQNDVFLSYPVLPTGLGTPVQSRVGSIHGAGPNPQIEQACGSMRASPNGKWLGATIPDQHAVEVFAFDNRTGRVSEGQRVPTPAGLPPTSAPYGLEFSANSGLLYFTAGGLIVNSTPAGGGLFQADLTQAGLPVTRLATGVFGALLRGPDARIYATTDLQALPINSLGVIALPDVASAGCTYLPAGASLGTGRRATGLPNFPNRVRQQVRIEGSATICVGGTAAFTAVTVALDLPGGVGAEALAWDFGDPAAGSANSASASSVTHRYTQAGAYTVTLTAASTNGPIQRRLDVRVTSLPSLRIAPRDTAVCEVPGVLLRASAQPAGAVFRWQDGSTGSTLRAQAPGRYRLEVRNAAGCTARDSVLVSTRPCAVIIPNIITPNDDRYNQAFVLSGLNAPDWNLRIFSRWGREVYRQERYDNKWMAQGQTDGMYFYLLTNPQTSQQLKGWVEVQR